MTKIKRGEQAPGFEGIGRNGEAISLAGMKGKKLILYFYPKDDTPGCTAEACDLNDHYERWIEEGFEVVGISPDSEKSHEKFIRKYGLKFHLLSDPQHEIMEKYGVWGEKKMYGKTYMGVLRTTFIIDETGMVQEVITNVDTKNHSHQIKELLNT
jgi:peroxiredoxin Q/BCP